MAINFFDREVVKVALENKFDDETKKKIKLLQKKMKFPCG